MRIFSLRIFSLKLKVWRQKNKLISCVYAWHSAGNQATSRKRVREKKCIYNPNRLSFIHSYSYQLHERFRKQSFHVFFSLSILLYYRLMLSCSLLLFRLISSQHYSCLNSTFYLDKNK